MKRSTIGSAVQKEKRGKDRPLVGSRLALLGETVVKLDALPGRNICQPLWIVCHLVANSLPTLSLALPLNELLVCKAHGWSATSTELQRGLCELN